MCVYAVYVCVCMRVWERGKRWSWGFSLERKQTVYKEGLPLSHFNVNESDSVRGLKNSLGAWRLPPLGSHMHMRAHTQACRNTQNTNAQAQTCMHIHKFWRREAQIKSSESLSECQLPLGQRLLCVCAGRRTAFCISFSIHTLFLTHTHPPRAAPPGWHAVSDKTHKRQRNPPEKTDISYISYITHREEKKTGNKTSSKWF